MEETIDFTKERGFQNRAREVFAERENHLHVRTDRMFAYLMIFQWIAGIVAAFGLSPRTWSGTDSSVHIHVWAALILGSLFTWVPVAMILLRPGILQTRLTVAIGQSLTGALLIHLSGGRIETHFHVFGSLAFLAFYRDWRVLLTATVVTALDHFLRGIYWPQSVFGVLAASQWRWVEHVAWVLFEDFFLFLSIRQGLREMWQVAERQLQLEMINQSIEHTVQERTRELQESNNALNLEMVRRRETEATLREAKEAAEAANRAKSDFLATMSHELRTPLNGMLGFTDLLLTTPLDQEQTEFAEIVKTSGSSLLHIINDILDFSKTESGQLEIDPQPFDLLRCCQDATQRWSSKALEKRLSLALLPNPATDSLATVMGDVERTGQVLDHLIGNAVKFSDAGSIHVALEITMDPSTDYEQCRVNIKDTGIGIPVEKQNQLFKKFMQVDSSSTRRYGGTGLGLAICKKLVELMGGTIGMKSEPGYGSTFWFALPLLKSVTANPPSDHSATFSVQPAVRKILIVEDVRSNQVLAERLCIKEHFDVKTVKDGREALQEVEATAYALILMDCQLPHLDGFNTTRVIRAREKEQAQVENGSEPPPRTPIVAITAYASEEDRRRCLEAGMDDFLAKPVDAKKFHAVLARWLPSTPFPDEELKKAS